MSSAWGDHLDGGRGAQHADLYSINVAVNAGGRLNLVGNHLRVNRDETVAPVVVGVKGNNAGKCSAAKYTQFVESF